MKRKKREFDNFWNFNFEDMFQSLRDEMEAMFKSNSSTYEENGPITYGYSLHIGPETNYQPEIRQWGNLNDYRKKKGFSELTHPFNIPETNRLSTGSPSNDEQYVDFVDENGDLRVIIEVPGFTQDNLDIEINETGTEISLKGNSEFRKINQVIRLPSKIEPNTSKSSLKNGVLEIRAKKLEESSKKFKIEIDEN